MNNNNRCFKCMTALGDSNVCPTCGFFESIVQPEYCLSPGTVLNQRYLIGNMICSNSEGITYIAYDYNIESKVEIREYIPLELSVRDKVSSNILPIQGKEIVFKALMSDFQDLATSISKFRTLPNIKQIYDIFKENNTVYYVSEYIEDGFTLEEMLAQTSGLIDWNKFSPLILPIISTIGILNASNIIHRGISTKSIYVTPKGDLKLGDFCVTAVRAHRSEISSEIVSGYAAPEQFLVNSWYGPWTDVYGICAVIYRVLTGVVPADARDRIEVEKLVFPRNVNPSISSAISNTILMGLSLSPEERIQSMQELVAQLSASVQQTDTSVMDTDNKKKKKLSTKQIIIISIIACIVLFGAFFAFLMFGLTPNNDTEETVSLNTISYVQETSSEETNSNEDVSSVDAAYAMPDLVGKEYSKVMITDDYTNLVQIEYKEDYSEEYQKGVIMKQSIAKDTPIPLNAKVTVTVSLGSKYVTVPDFKGDSFADYLIELSGLNIPYKVRLKDQNGELGGNIVEVTPSVGEQIDLTDTSASILIYLDNENYSASNSDENVESTIE